MPRNPYDVQRALPRPAQGSMAEPTQMQLEMPLHALPTMAPPMPATSSSGLIPEINDVEPEDAMEVGSGDDSAP
eukprot:11234742-Alexandrium_andersonii.AAC.1